MQIISNTKTVAAIAALTLGLSCGVIYAENGGGHHRSKIEVTITNITNNQLFTNVLVASHQGKIGLFTLGEQASDELVSIAEGGATGPMTELLKNNKRVADVTTTSDPLAPGASVTVILSANKHSNRISLAAMMLPTNDSFIALDSVRVPRNGRTKTYLSPGYDAGSETNDESCLSIPGPFCNGAPFSPEDDGEGYVHISRGIGGNGDLIPAVFDWRNPVASISVRRIRNNAQ